MAKRKQETNSRDSEMVVSVRKVVRLLSQSEKGRVILPQLEARFSKVYTFVEQESKYLYWASLLDNEIGKAKRPLSSTHPNDRVFALIRAMLERTSSHVFANIIATMTGSGFTVEAIARVIIEASVNVTYILKSDPPANLVRYLYSHVDKERKELEQWLRSLHELTGDELTYHQNRIATKERLLQDFEQITAQLAEDVGIQASQRAWPSIAERFRAIGKEVEYRTVYASLCSQVHGDAEDIFNVHLVESMQMAGLAESMAMGNTMFQRTALRFSMIYFMQAVSAFAKVYSFQKLYKKAQEGQGDIQAIQYTVGFEA